MTALRECEFAFEDDALELDWALTAETGATALVVPSSPPINFG
jgi:hypothetical protein